MSRDPLANLARLLARLPGIGQKTGARLAYYLWQAPGQYPEELALALKEVREQVRPCPVCGAPSREAPCVICGDPERDHSAVMVVEDPQDLAAIENTGVFKGAYHVLGGKLSPLAGKGPESLRLQPLLERLAAGQVREVILALSPSTEGDATAAFLEETILACHPDLALSRLARGLPAGAELKYLDPLSLELSVKGRRK